MDTNSVKKNNEPVENAAELISKAKAGDKDAFGRLYESYYVPVYRYIYFRLRDRHTAEDITQTVFLKVFQSIANFVDMKRDPFFYFLASARNALIDYYRKKKDIILNESEEYLLFEQPASARDFNEHLQTKIDSHMVQEMISELPASQQEVLILRLINDLSHNSIAQITGKSSDAVRQIYARALQNLRIIIRRKPQGDLAPKR